MVLSRGFGSTETWTREYRIGRTESAMGFGLAESPPREGRGVALNPGPVGFDFSRTRRYLKGQVLGRLAACFLGGP